MFSRVCSHHFTFCKEDRLANENTQTTLNARQQVVSPFALVDPVSEIEIFRKFILHLEMSRSEAFKFL